MRRPPPLTRLRLRLRAWRGRKLSYKHTFAFDWLRPGDVVVDCGANVGKVTALLRARGATVHAFEPDPVAFAHLRARFSDRPGVVLHAAAVGVVEGRAPLYVRADREDTPVATLGSSLRLGSRGLDAGRSVDVEVVDLARFLDGLGEVALLKLDIEGSEVGVLPRLASLGLLARVGLTLVETHERQNPALAEATMAMRRAVAASGARDVYLNWR